MLTRHGDPDTFSLIAATLSPPPEAHADARWLEPYARWLESNGIRRLFVGGTTGQWHHLSPADRLNILDAWLGLDADRFDLIFHVGSRTPSDAAFLAREAARRSVRSIGALVPHTGSREPRRQAEQAHATLAAIGEAAPDLRLFYYHMPEMDASAFDVSRLLDEARETLPTLAGVKFTHHDLLDFRVCVSGHGQDLEMLYGRDQQLVQAIVTGATGAVGSTYNVIGAHFRAVAAAAIRGDTAAAMAQFDRVTPLFPALSRLGVVAVLKAMLRHRGIDLGGDLSPEAADHDESERVAASLAQTLPLLDTLERDADAEAPLRQRQCAHPPLVSASKASTDG